MSDLKKICDDLKTHSNLFAQSAVDHWSQFPSDIDKPVRRILLRGSEIVRGAADLGLSENPTALGILSRQLLELFISLQWVISDEKRAALYTDFAINELDRLAQMNMREGLLSVKTKNDGSNVTDKFLSTRAKPKKGVSAEQQARECGLFHLYQIFYRFMSLETHGKSETVVNPAERGNLTSLHLSTVGAISLAFGHVAILWLSHRHKADNEKLRELLGLNDKNFQLIFW